MSFVLNVVDLSLSSENKLFAASDNCWLNMSLYDLNYKISIDEKVQ